MQPVRWNIDDFLNIARYKPALYGILSRFLETNRAGLLTPTLRENIDSNSLFTDILKAVSPNNTTGYGQLHITVDTTSRTITKLSASNVLINNWVLGERVEITPALESWLQINNALDHSIAAEPITDLTRLHYEYILARIATSPTTREALITDLNNALLNVGLFGPENASDATQLFNATLPLQPLATQLYQKAKTEQHQVFPALIEQLLLAFPAPTNLKEYLSVVLSAWDMTSETSESFFAKLQQYMGNAQALADVARQSPFHHSLVQQLISYSQIHASSKRQLLLAQNKPLNTQDKAEFTDELLTALNVNTLIAEQEKALHRYLSGKPEPKPKDEQSPQPAELIAKAQWFAVSNQVNDIMPTPALKTLWGLLLNRLQFYRAQNINIPEAFITSILDTLQKPLDDAQLSAMFALHHELSDSAHSTVSDPMIQYTWVKAIIQYVRQLHMPESPTEQLSARNIIAQNLATDALGMNVLPSELATHIIRTLEGNQYIDADPLLRVYAWLDIGFKQSRTTLELLELFTATLLSLWAQKQLELTKAQLENEERLKTYSSRIAQCNQEIEKLKRPLKDAITALAKLNTEKAGLEKALASEEEPLQKQIEDIATSIKLTENEIEEKSKPNYQLDYQQLRYWQGLLENSDNISAAVTASYEEQRQTAVNELNELARIQEGISQLQKTLTKTPESLLSQNKRDALIAQTLSAWFPTIPPTRLYLIYALLYCMPMTLSHSKSFNQRVLSSSQSITSAIHALLDNHFKNLDANTVESFLKRSLPEDRYWAVLSLYKSVLSAVLPATASTAVNELYRSFFKITTSELLGAGLNLYQAWTPDLFPLSADSLTESEDQPYYNPFFLRDALAQLAKDLKQHSYNFPNDKAFSLYIQLASSLFDGLTNSLLSYKPRQAQYLEDTFTQHWLDGLFSVLPVSRKQALSCLFTYSNPLLKETIIEFSKSWLQSVLNIAKIDSTRLMTLLNPKTPDLSEQTLKSVLPLVWQNDFTLMQDYVNTQYEVIYSKPADTSPASDAMSALPFAEAASTLTQPSSAGTSSDKTTGHDI